MNYSGRIHQPERSREFFGKRTTSLQLTYFQVKTHRRRPILSVGLLDMIVANSEYVPVSVIQVTGFLSSTPFSCKASTPKTGCESSPPSFLRVWPWQR
jgi:hypothetical protein